MKRVNLETTVQRQQSKLLEICKDKPFWLWYVQEHKLQNIKKKGIAALIILSVYQQKCNYLSYLYPFCNCCSSG